MPLRVEVPYVTLEAIGGYAELNDYLRTKGIRFSKDGHKDSFPEEPFHMYRDESKRVLVVEQGAA